MPRRLLLPRSLAALVVAVAVAALPAVALAHAELVSSDPEAGANLNTAPTEVTLTFDDELDPDGSGFTVTDHHGDEVGTGELDLDVADRNVVRGAVSISEPGVYTVEWAILGLDGHEISGSFSFGYQSDEEIPEGDRVPCGYSPALFRQSGGEVISADQMVVAKVLPQPPWLVGNVGCLDWRHR